MPASGGRPLQAGVRFDQVAFSEDLAHATPAGRQVALQARSQLERDGVPISQLRRCDDESRDTTSLPRCAKLYLPQPAGPWRMVFRFTLDRTTSELVLLYLAFGLGHPTKPWQPSAYQVAHRRLHPGE